LPCRRPNRTNIRNFPLIPVPPRHVGAEQAEITIQAYDAERDARPAAQSRRAKATAPQKSSRSRYAIDPSIQSLVAVSDGVAYADAVSLPSAGKLRQSLLQLSVERCLEAWIQFHQDFVRCCSRRCLLGGEMRCPKANQVRLVSAVDGVDSVIYRSVHDGKAAGGVNGCEAVRQGCGQ